MGTTWIASKETNHFSSAAADLHPVRQRKTCLIGCTIASNCFTIPASVVYLDGNHTHPCTKTLLDSSMVSVAGLRAARISHTCSMELKSEDITYYCNR
ncbi:hypothetical protein TNCV_1043271 [Trichonephila clavipes]|nr:hypothetical protein TNCV_1043271 [Trichonephila clavipes]